MISVAAFAATALLAMSVGAGTAMADEVRLPADGPVQSKACPVASPLGGSGLVVSGTHAFDLSCREWLRMVSYRTGVDGRAPVTVWWGGAAWPGGKRFRCSMPMRGGPENGYTMRVTCFSVQRYWATVRYVYRGL